MGGLDTVLDSLRDKPLTVLDLWLLVAENVESKNVVEENQHEDPICRPVESWQGPNGTNGDGHKRVMSLY